MTRDEAVQAAGDDDLLFADGFDEAIIGVGRRCGQPTVVVYSYDRCVQVLMDRDGMDRDEAEEFLEFNTVGAWVGDRTPLWLVTPLAA